MGVGEASQVDTREKRDLNICPRCGLEFSYIEEKRVGDRHYIYAVHYIYSSGKRLKKRCYLGPLSQYEHVERLHKLMSLTNLHRQDYLKTALRSIEKEINLVMALKSQGRSVNGERHRLIEILKEKLNELEKLIEETAQNRR